MTLYSRLKQLLHPLATRLILAVMARPRMKQWVRSRLAAFPRLEARLRAYAVYTPSSNEHALHADLLVSSPRTLLVRRQLCRVLAEQHALGERDTKPCG